MEVAAFVVEVDVDEAGAGCGGGIVVLSEGGRNGRFTAADVADVEDEAGCCWVFCAGACEVVAAGCDVDVEVEVEVEDEVEVDVADVLIFVCAVFVTCLFTFVHIRPWNVVKFGSDIYDVEDQFR